MSEASADLLDDLDRFLHDYYRDAIGELVEHYPREQQSLSIDWQDLWRFNSDFADDYIDSPKQVSDYLDEALGLYDLPVDVDLSEASVRVVNLPDESRYNIGRYRPNEVLDSLVVLRGQVTKRSQRQLRIVEAAFRCARCGTVTYVPQPTEEFQEPHECSGCERQGPFTRADTESEVIDHQHIRLQTLPESTEGTATDTIDVTLSGDLVGEVAPGDRIAANALIRGTQPSDSRPVLELEGEAESIEHLETDHEDIDISPYRDAIEGVATSTDPGPYEQIVNSIAPTHKGNDLVKEALAYQLFGGVGADLPDGSTLRGTSHILLIGDPGSGKSQLLEYIRELAPRSVYASGKQTTSAGLTAAAVRSQDFGDSAEWSLEAGALVESHGGIACIDELDKMSPNDQSGMLESMSEQSVSVSKAGITATLPASTTILAAANPTHGRFDRYESISEQLGLDSVLLSRFDLVFTMSDRPDEEKDREIASHMNNTARVGEQLAAGERPDDDLTATVTPTLGPDLLRAYVAHAKTLNPELTDEAAELIEDEYVKIRDANDEDGPVPTTAREVDAIRRLAEAAARIRLSKWVETQDVARVLKVWRGCLSDLGIDPDTGEFDADILEGNEPKSQRDRMKKLESLLKELQRDFDSSNGVPEDEFLDIAEDDLGIERSQAKHDIQTWRDRGDVYAPADGYVRWSS